jgi:predicted secreted protein
MFKYVLVFISIILFLSRCSGISQPAEFQLVSPVLGPEIDNQKLVCPPGQRFLLQLDLSADAGYQWDYYISDVTVIQLDSATYRPKSGELIWGGLTIETFYFRAAKQGLCSINLQELRGWEKDIPPISTLQFAVMVK